MCQFAETSLVVVVRDETEHISDSIQPHPALTFGAVIGATLEIRQGSETLLFRFILICSLIMIFKHNNDLVMHLKLHKAFWWLGARKNYLCCLVEFSGFASHQW